ncbi:MOSC domain-containing protein [Anaerobacillus alkalidiazotrophicus]|uniref:MOSC domain-containing protein n=1 Tax=Anaerobacillus alkalidiazotrophicus TaxID=472963 RepID=A0A1S2M4C6_9BACI|nr:MOSC domain-containing protein [Anaerobacillus alkalidiazotrophicus]OIJ19464.1 MOSC domain-containing protein [Anaerobacillus alkalidiazotrophicus]
MPNHTNKIISVNVGMPKSITFQEKILFTGINKQEVNKPVFLYKEKFEGDGQADLDNHGGEDKAVCVYSYQHYPYWQKRLQQPLSYGAFGENLTIEGLTEEVVCIGDIYELGEAIVQVTQPRQPCYKLAKIYDQDKLPIWFQNSGYTGYYFRVLQEGIVTKVKPIKLLERPTKNVTVSFANNIMYHDKINIEGIKKILEVDELSTSWRNVFLKRMGV